MRIFCFSGTGNSYSVAEEIGKSFSVEPELITHFKSQDSIKVADSQIGIIAPIYLNDIPRIVKEFILRLSFEETNTYVFTVLTSGSGKNKNGFNNINIALAQHNVKLSLAFDIQMPSSFQTRDDMESVLGKASPKIVEVITAIEGRRENYVSQGSTTLPKGFTKLSFLYRPLARMTVTDKCNGCGLCCKLCPTNNIELQGGKAVRGKNCIACTACANWCPQRAISSRMLKGQYHHPKVIAADLL